MKKTLDIAIVTLFVLMMLGINVVVGYGVIWELFLSPNEPQWLGMITTAGMTLLFDLVVIRDQLD